MPADRETVSVGGETVAEDWKTSVTEDGGSSVTDNRDSAVTKDRYITNCGQTTTTTTTAWKRSTQIPKRRSTAKWHTYSPEQPRTNPITPTQAKEGHR